MVVIMLSMVWESYNGSLGNVVSCYADIIKVGRTSITVKIEVWAQRHDDLDEPAKVTEGIFTYVALDKSRRPRAVTSRVS